MVACRVCQQSVIQILDLGSQPISNRFFLLPSKREVQCALVLGFCEHCGLTQLLNPPSSVDVRPLFDWIRYNEPEYHLDKVAEQLSHLPGIDSNSLFCGISGQEYSTLERLKKRGFNYSWQLSLQDDLEEINPLSGVETIQTLLTPATAKRILKKRERPHVIIARYILEHAHDPLQFLNALKNLLQPGGYLVIEVPDNTRIFEFGEHSVLWEEHVSYFTPCSFIQCLERAGLKLISFEIYPASLENAMVAMVSIPEAEIPRQKNEANLALLTERETVLRYASLFADRRVQYQKILRHHRSAGKIALFGAGHLACHFINLMQLENEIDFIIDDHPHKKGMFMPGTQLVISPSSILESENIALCLLSLSPESEQKVVQNKQDFVRKGGKFYSIFSTSQISLLSSIDHLEVQCGGVTETA